MAGAVYILCALTSLLCAALLLRSYSAKRVRLLLWGGLCFTALTVQNILLFVDLVIYPEIDLSMPRNLVALAGITVLLYGLVWDRQS